jgi:hypothetical protein
MGYTFGPKGFARGCKVFFLQINRAQILAQIVIHKTQKPEVRKLWDMPSPKTVSPNHWRKQAVP